MDLQERKGDKGMDLQKKTTLVGDWFEFEPFTPDDFYVSKQVPAIVEHKEKYLRTSAHVWCTITISPIYSVAEKLNTIIGDLDHHYAREIFSPMLAKLSPEGNELSPHTVMWNADFVLRKNTPIEVADERIQNAVDTVNSLIEHSEDEISSYVKHINSHIKKVVDEINSEAIGRIVSSTDQMKEWAALAENKEAENADPLNREIADINKQISILQEKRKNLEYELQKVRNSGFIKVLISENWIINGVKTPEALRMAFTRVLTTNKGFNPPTKMRLPA